MWNQERVCWKIDVKLGKSSTRELMWNQERVPKIWAVDFSSSFQLYLAVYFWTKYSMCSLFYAWVLLDLFFFSSFFFVFLFAYS